jgi:hypothetical protein
LVDQGGFAVVDVGDDRHVAQMSGRNGVTGAWHGAIRVEESDRSGSKNTPGGGHAGARRCRQMWRREAGQELYGNSTANVR